jgi:hypothetical protein
MAVQKFRTLAEAERSLWLEPGDPRIWDGVVRRWNLHRFFAPRSSARRATGVFKYRSVEHKQQRDAARTNSEQPVPA